MIATTASDPITQFAEFEAQLGVAQHALGTETSSRILEQDVDGKPVVGLPHNEISISHAGRRLGDLLAATKNFFRRGKTVAKLVQDHDGLPQLETAMPAALASEFESVAALVKMDGEKTKCAICSEQTAKLISASAPFLGALPPIHVLTRCPVLIDRGGRLVQIAGYDRESGIYAGGKAAEAMDLTEALRLLSEVLEGFRFAAPADRARALAAMITPALVFGGILKGRAPLDVCEADKSQSGKGYRNKLTAAIYSQRVQTVTQQSGGIGSLDESFDAALIRGANFISIDNVRGKIDSPKLESFLTEDIYLARGLYREHIGIDPRRVVVMLTSNTATLSIDLANRCCCVRILKQPEDFAFKSYAEGDILDHVRALQPRYLGAVFAVVQAWHAAGCPKSAERRHSFQPWAPTLDWLTRNLLGAGALLDSHRETQARMANPAVNWLRDVAMDVIRNKQDSVWLRASHLITLLVETGTEVPGLTEHMDVGEAEARSLVQQAMGRRLGLCFRASDVVHLDTMTVERREQYDEADHYKAREYRFTAGGRWGDGCGRTPFPPLASHLP